MTTANGFAVEAGHTYAEQGSYTPIVTINDGGGSTTTVTDSATIADAALTATAVSISGTEGAALAGTTTVATFTDADPNGTLGGYTATINWGDGHTSSGIIVTTANGFAVEAGHTYAEQGSYTPIVTINDGGGSTTTVTDSATIADAALTATAVSISGTEGAALAGTTTVATFTDADPNGTLGGYTATINWGDGHTSSGIIVTTANGFAVEAGHTYAEQGSYTPIVTINDGGGSTTTVTDSATIADAALTATAVSISGTEGAALAGTTTVATFTDADPNGTLGGYTATINWGDGHTSSGIIVTTANGFAVEAGHTYAEQGSYTPIVTINDGGGSTTTVTDSATIADAALTATAVSISGTEGAALAGTTTVATFTDADPNGTLGGYTATINWGDGHTSSGIIVTTANGFAVEAGHTYAEQGSYTPIVTINDGGGSTTTVTDSATIADAALTATAVSISGTEGAALAGTTTVATFTDADPNGTLGGYTATINWGDGHTSSGIIVTTANGFAVEAGHTYAEQGSYTPIVTINDGGGSTTTVTDSATIADAALTATAVSISGTEGAALAGTTTVATFTDADPNGTLGGYTATINWGDGHTSSGIIVTTANGFAVEAGHTYAEQGSYTPIVTINDGGGSTTTVTDSATIADAALTATAVSISGTEGAALAGTTTVATFTDADPNGTLGDYTATINWGDGHTSSGIIVTTANGFAVEAGHTYAEQGSYTPIVTINDGGGSTTTVTDSATINPTDTTAPVFADSINGQYAFTGTKTNLGSYWTFQAAVTDDDAAYIGQGGIVKFTLYDITTSTLLGTATFATGTWTNSGLFSSVAYAGGIYTISTSSTTAIKNGDTLELTAYDDASLSALRSVTLTNNSSFAVRPAGVAGDPVNLALTDPSGGQALGPITLTVTGVPSDWRLNEGANLGNGTWTVETSDLTALSVTTAAAYLGAMVLNATETWTNADGSTGSAIVADNVEAYAPGSPVFALSGDDTLTGSGANDLFVFAQPIGNDVVYNFNAASDKLDLVGFNGIAALSDVRMADDVNGNAVITLGSGETITLHGVDASSLTANDFVFNQTPVMENAGNMVISDGAMLPLGGTIDNTGAIALNSTGDATDLQIIGDGITLQGGGQVTLSDSSANAIVGTTPTSTLTNVDNTIYGAGQIGSGDGTLTLLNEAHGTIDANYADGTLTLHTGNIIVNEGLLESTDGSTLQIDDNVSNPGTLAANGGTIIAAGDVTGSGDVAIGGGGQADFAGAFNESVTFTGPGTLELSHSQTYSGTVGGFGAGDVLDLNDLAYSANETVTWTQGNGSGTLTIQDNGSTANITLQGSYAQGEFALTIDATPSGGTDVISSPVVDSTALPGSSSVTGNMSFAKSNTNDTYSASVTPEASEYVGSFSLGAMSTSNGSASVAWGFDLGNDQINLAPSQTETQSFNVSVNEGPNTVLNQTVSVSFGGSSNDNYPVAPGIGADMSLDFLIHSTIPSTYLTSPMFNRCSS